MKKRNRHRRVVVCFNDAEIEQLNKNVLRSGMSREAYIRSFISGKTPVCIPSKDYFRLAKEIRAAGNTLNRIAAALFSRGILDEPTYQRNAEKVLRIADEMHMALAPRKEK